MIRNFRPLDGSEGFAIVETSILGMFKKDRTVFKNSSSSYWRWLDDGELTPGTKVEDLEGRYYALKRFS